MDSSSSAIDFAVFQTLCEAHVTQTSDPDSYAEAQTALLALMGNLPGMAYCCHNDEHSTLLFVSEG